MVVNRNGTDDYNMNDNTDNEKKNYIGNTNKISVKVIPSANFLSQLIGFI